MIGTYLKLGMTALGGAGLLTKVIIALGLAGSLLVAYGVWHHRVYQSGVNDTLAKIAKADARMVARALEMRRALSECNAAGHHWNQSTGRCQ